jgi:cytochrome c553
MTRAALLAVLVTGCRVAPPMATLADAQRANVQLAELQDGRALVVRKCGNCHAPPVPKDHTAGEWPKQLDEMSVRANLDRKQRFLIQQYFVVMTER